MLRIWQSFNGDSANKGLIGDVTTVTAPTFVDGKIGKALSSGQFSITAEQANEVLNNNYFSLCFWIYNNVAAGTSITRTLFGNSSMTAPNNRRYTTFIYPTVNQLHLSWQNYDSNNASVTFVSGTDLIPSYNWVHIAVTYDGPNGIITVYKNGEVYRTVTTTSHFSSPNYSYAQNLVTNYANQYINDYRVYDHCLSAKEVKEISKALVLHYKLDETYGMTNILANTVLSCYNNYGSTGCSYTATDIGETYMGQKVRRWSYTPLTDSVATAFRSGYYSRGVYTSWVYIDEVNGTRPYVYWIYYRPQTSGLTAGGTASNIGGWTEIPREYVGDGWWRVGQYRTKNTNTGRTNDAIFTSIRWEYAAANQSCQIDFVDAGWLLSGATSIPSNFVDGNSVVHDCSGYGNDGTIGGSPKPITGSPRYETATSLEGSSYINAGRGSMVTNALTVAVWAHSTAWASAGRIASCTEGGGWNFENGNGYLRFPVYAGGYALATDTLPLSSYSSGWHHIVGTFDGPSKKNCFYRDGQFIASATTTNSAMTYYSNNSVFIGAEAAASTTTPSSPYFNGYVSDFRVYGTALSPEDIAELYHTAASVDNKGNFHCYELKEV